MIYIENHYYEDISLRDIVHAASSNHSTLTQVFKNELGMTAMDYLWHYRIKVACKHLAFTQLSVKEIQIRCGFKTLQHFCRKFEEIMGTTATAYRTDALQKRKDAFK